MPLTRENYEPAPLEVEVRKMDIETLSQAKSGMVIGQELNLSSKSVINMLNARRYGAYSRGEYQKFRRDVNKGVFKGDFVTWVKERETERFFKNDLTTIDPKELHHAQVRDPSDYISSGTDSEEQKGVLEALFDCLGKKELEVITGLYLEGFNHKQMHFKIGCALSSVYAIEKTALRKMRQCADKYKIKCFI